MTICDYPVALFFGLLVYGFATTWYGIRSGRKSAMAHHDLREERELDRWSLELLELQKQIAEVKANLEQAQANMQTRH